MKKIIILLIALISIALFLNSCSKKKQETLVGSWTEMTYYPDHIVYTWEFVEGNQVIRRRVDGSNVDSGAYRFSSKFPNKYLELLNFDDSGATNGKYFLDDLDDEVLTMTRVEMEEDPNVEEQPAPYMRKEFVRFE